MKKIIPVVHKKLWGKEIWLHSPLEGMRTKFDDEKENSFGPLIKIIEANLPLSIQVHPDDDLARKIENMPNGKNEGWYILDKSKGSKIVYGSKTIDQDVIRKAVNSNKLEHYVSVIDAQINSFYNVPAGLIHGLGFNQDDYIKVLEIQQPSDVTYRLYDYHRKQADGSFRELHLEKSLISLKYTSIDSKKSKLNDDITIYELDNYLLYKLNSGSLQFDKYAWVINSQNFETFLFEPSESINIGPCFIVVER